MLVTKVRFDSQRFLLDPAQDVRRTKEEIVNAVRGQGDFVDFATIGHGTISLLITPSVPIRFEVIERTEAEVAALEAHPPPLDESDVYDWDF
jgi:hypothetical protein